MQWLFLGVLQILVFASVYVLMIVDADPAHWLDSYVSVTAIGFIFMLLVIAAALYLSVTISIYRRDRRWGLYQDLVTAGPEAMRYEIMKDSGIDPKDWPPLDTPGNQGPVGDRGPRGCQGPDSGMKSEPQNPSDILKKGDPL
jgi:hypothetical protein